MPLALDQVFETCLDSLETLPIISNLMGAGAILTNLPTKLHTEEANQSMLGTSFVRISKEVMR